MSPLLLAAGLFVLVTTIDYVRYVLQDHKYKYVSRSTYFLYICGVLAVIGLFHMELMGFFQTHWKSELFFISLAFIASLLASYTLDRNRIRICLTILRTGKCFEPAYIFIKSKEILFQQLLFLIMALAVSREIGFNFSGFLTYISIIALIQIPLMLHVERFWKYLFGLGFVFMSIIFFYTYLGLGLLWPALYVHALFYAFIWLALSDPTVEND